MDIQPWTIFISATIVTLAGFFVRGVFLIIQSIRIMSKSVEKLLEADAKHMEAIAAIAKLQRPQLYAHKATLEALKEGRCNGNVEDAKEMILAAFDEYDRFLVGRMHK
jgi:hypothetical protein